MILFVYGTLKRGGKFHRMLLVFNPGYLGTQGPMEAYQVTITTFIWLTIFEYVCGYLPKKELGGYIYRNRKCEIYVLHSLVVLFVVLSLLRLFGVI